MTSEEIKVAIKRYPVSLGCFSVKYDINAGVMLRNSNAFACQNFIMVGHSKFDRRPSMGCQNYENMVKLEDTEALSKWLRAENRTLVGVDYIEGISYPINGVEMYPKDCLFIMGSERNGLPKEVISMCSLVVHIPQYGSVRSLNVGVASGIILQDWHGKNNAR